MNTIPALTQVREFLAAEGCAPLPWSTAEAVLERLYGLLLERRDDERFWARLLELARRLDGTQLDARALPGFEVLGQGAIDRLIDQARRSLGPRGPGRQPLREWLGRSVGTGAVVLLLLGLSVSCKEEEPAVEERDWTVETWDCQDQADEYGLTDAEDVDRLCQLGDFVKQAVDVSQADKVNLLDCLPGLDAARRESLLERWQGAESDEDLAIMLSDLAEIGECSPDYYPDDGGHGCGFSAH